MRCRECGATELVHDGVGSLVCPDCGTLADPTQAVFADRGEHSTTSYAAPRTSKGWHLAQTKQDRDRKNTIAMNTFINTVLSRLNNPGLSPRAEAIFTQAMAKGHYRWGRKAKLTAGASIAIALREAHKSDSLRDIAFFLDESPLSLARAFQSVVSLLDFSLASIDPAAHLPTLHHFLQSIIHPESVSSSPPSQLPKSLVSILTPLSLQAAIRTATSLSQIISHHSPPLPLSSLPTPPTACALCILGLEAETRTPLPHLGELTRMLAARFALSPGVVASRYKVIYDLIEGWIRHVPWLDQFVYKNQGRNGAARSKASKRSIVAKGAKDVVQFHEEIWLSRMQSQKKVNLVLEPDPRGFANRGEEARRDNRGADTSTIASSSKSAEEFAIALPPRKRRKVEKGNPMQMAYQLLLHPLSSGSPDLQASNSELSMLTHLLTCSPDEFVQAQGTPPTRLQLLAASRGGSTVEHIADEELFTDGELEGLLRSEQEREALQPLFQLNWDEEVSAESAAVRHREPVAAESKRGAKRINMDALTRLMDGNADSDGSGEEDVTEFPDADNDAYLWGWDDYTHRSSGYRCQSTTEGDELAGDCRPISSDDDSVILGESSNVTDDRYEEEL